MQERALLPLIHDRVPAHIQTELEFAAVFEAYYKRIFNYIAYRVSCRYTAEDLASQVFEKTLSKLPGYSPEKAPLEVWLFAIARNVVNDYYRMRAAALLHWTVSGSWCLAKRAGDAHPRQRAQR